MNRGFYACMCIVEGDVSVRYAPRAAPWRGAQTAPGVVTPPHARARCPPPAATPTRRPARAPGRRLARRRAAAPRGQGGVKHAPRAGGQQYTSRHSAAAAPPATHIQLAAAAAAGAVLECARAAGTRASPRSSSGRCRRGATCAAAAATTAAAAAVTGSDATWSTKAGGGGGGAGWGARVAAPTARQPWRTAACSPPRPLRRCCAHSSPKPKPGVSLRSSGSLSACRGGSRAKGDCGRGCARRGNGGGRALRALRGRACRSCAAARQLCRVVQLVVHQRRGPRHAAPGLPGVASKQPASDGGGGGV